MKNKSKKVIERYQKIMDTLEINPYFTLAEISLITGIPIPTISRIIKDYNNNKKDLRKKENYIAKIKGELKNEISDN